MREHAACFHNLEWPSAGDQLAGPVVWLRGWIVGKPGYDFVDIRVLHASGTHRGVLGLPRTDLAAHFKSSRPWLPAEFILGVPVDNGPVTLMLEALDARGTWHELTAIDLLIMPGGTPAPRIEGRLEISTDGTWTVRDAHHPFHGHLDQPGPAPQPQQGRAPVFGWLLDQTRPLAAVLATTDTLVFNHLEHSLTDPTLAAKVPQLPAARLARLRGAVDLPANLAPPACLRVYAISPDGTPALCFAQRLAPVIPPPPVPIPPLDYPPVSPRKLTALPSGRPRRVLLVLRSLWPNDATLRALDIARHLTASSQWAARVVSTEDGPLRRDFEQAGVESLVVNPEALFAAPDEAAMQHALDGLRRQIWWSHLDVVVVFDPICGWAIRLARSRGIPVLFDCQTDAPMTVDPTAIPAVQSLLRSSWREASIVCFASAAAALAQTAQLADRKATIIPQWHTPDLTISADRRVGIVPLRVIDWVARYHPEVAARWTFRQGPSGLNQAEQLARQDDAFNAPVLHRTADWSVADASLVLGPLFARGPLRPTLDAAVLGLPVAAPRSPTTEEWFAGTNLPLVADNDPLALVQTLLNPIASPAPALRARHDPQTLLPRWAALLATAAATHG